MKRNLQHIDEMRFFIIHLILINHWSINLFLLNVSYNHKISDIFIDLTSPILALMSGFLFFYKTRDNLHYGKKLKSRFHSLVVPYLFWALSFFIVYIVLKDVFVRVFHKTFWYGAEESLSFHNLIDSLIHPPLKNFWYLQNLILITPLSIVIYYLLKNKYVFFTVYILMVCCYMFKWTSLHFESRFLPYYLLGAWFGYNEKSLPQIKISNTGSWLLLPVLTVVGLFSSYYNDDVFPVLVLKVPLYTIYVITLYNMLDAHHDTFIFRYLRKYKPYSFFLFAINVFAFALVQRPLLMLGARNYLHYEAFLFFFLMLSFVGVLVITFLIAGSLNKRFNRFYGAITGR